MKKVIIIIAIIASIVIANIIIVNVVNQNNGSGQTANTHVNTNINRVGDTNAVGEEKMLETINRKRKLRKGRVFLVILILIIIVTIVIFAFNRANDNQQQEEQEVTTNTVDNSNNGENQSFSNTAEIETEERWEWQHDTLENHNISVSAIDSVHSIIDEYPINAEVIVKDGVIVDEYYKEGYDQNSTFTLQSTSKTITSAILGIAIDKGYIESVNVPISNYFPQILESNSDYLKDITIWHLLTHTSGLNASDTGNWYEWRSSDNWVDYVLNTPVTSRPGTVFNYFTGNTHLLSAIIQQAIGKTTYEFGKEYLFI